MVRRRLLLWAVALALAAASPSASVGGALGEPDFECAACRLANEVLQVRMTGFLRRNSHKVPVGQTAQVSIDTAAVMDGLCDDEAFGEPRLPQLRQECEALLSQHAADLLTPWLGKSPDFRGVSIRARETCVDKLGVCDMVRERRAERRRTRCEACHAAVGSLVETLKLVDTGTEQKMRARAWDALDTTCSELPMRHPVMPSHKSEDDLQEHCDRLVDEHDERIVQELVDMVEGQNPKAAVCRAVGYCARDERPEL